MDKIKAIDSLLSKHYKMFAVFTFMVIISMIMLVVWFLATPGASFEYGAFKMKTAETLIQQSQELDEIKTELDYLKNNSIPITKMAPVYAINWENQEMHTAIAQAFVSHYKKLEIKPKTISYRTSTPIQQDPNNIIDITKGEGNILIEVDSNGSVVINGIVTQKKSNKNMFENPIRTQALMLGNMEVAINSRVLDDKLIKNYFANAITTRIQSGNAWMPFDISNMIIYISTKVESYPLGLIMYDFDVNADEETINVIVTNGDDIKAFAKEIERIIRIYNPTLSLLDSI